MSLRNDIRDLRMKYLEKEEVFLENNIEVKDPMVLFNEWFKIALNTEDVLEPNAACLSTVNEHGLPSSRFILLKDITSEGFTFFTNYGSRKAKEIQTNPNVALTLYWCSIRKSVRIEGKAEKISSEESLKYFRQRPRSSQISALASSQSTIIKCRKELDEIKSKFELELKDKEVPLPNWGGYLIKPCLIEFWQGQSNRLHDRIRFRRLSNLKEGENRDLIHEADNGWFYERLAP